VYFDNHGIAMKRSGEIWLSMAKDIYVEENRKMKAIDDKGGRSSVYLKRPIVGEKGMVEIENNLDDANMEVLIDIGEAYASRREKTVSNLTKLLPTVATVDPVQAGLMANTIMVNMDGEAIGDLKEYNRKKLLQAGVIEPTEEEAEEMAQAQANQQPDPQSMYLMAEAGKAEANAMLSKANTAKSIAESEKIKMETVKLMADMDSQEQDRIIKAIDTALKVKASDAPQALS
jgi:hypothetical protein